ncbi:SulP family inorganic anion transporter [Haliscomenobacter hydrossis]|uniref:Sulfate transporter n=1 Tax=Haliscomenobacter hydrossis (strain ATCC 27775 / DSM 1100 / LMG 10767 / O) TaxID=760192 RepID=F4L6J8_HALH1|nr:solute carrier family 26 protein [Haliscomenobacter hydrossis]AEE49841.1 sulfate transporter [Haliscomenobacter hydrossis DSM 1100]
MLKRFLPILDWLPKYSKDQLQGDLSAGLTVGVMLIPQGMAYAMLAGLDPIHGLYAVTVPLMLYAVLGTSRQLAVGPVAMVSLLTAAGIGALQPATPELYLVYALTAAFLVGIFQLAMGVFRLGFLVSLLSHPVISGFTSAAAIIIGLSQLKHLLRIDLPKSEHIQEMMVALAKNIGNTHLLTVGIGLIAIVVIKYGKKIHKSLPTSLLAVMLGILAVWGLNLTEQGIKIVGEVPSGLPGLSAPSFDPAVWKSLLSVALTISLVGFMESFAVAKAIQAKHKDYQVDANQELIALGTANLGAAFFQGYPITGGFSRTAVNDQAGAKTGMASIFSAILIVLTLLFLTPLFYYLPNAVLAAVVIVAVIGLIDLKEAFHLWKEDRSDFWMLIATFVITLTMGIETGIGAGVVLSLAMVVYRSTRPHIAVLGKVPNSTYYRNVQRFEKLEQREDILMLRMDGPLYFANLTYFKDRLMNLMTARGKALKAVIINADSISHVDSSAVHALKDWVTEIQAQGITLYFTSLIGPVRDIFAKTGLVELIGENHLYMSNQQAVDHFDHTPSNQGETQDYKDYALQSNVKK